MARLAKRASYVYSMGMERGMHITAIIALAIAVGLLAYSYQQNRI